MTAKQAFATTSVLKLQVDGTGDNPAVAIANLIQNSSGASNGQFAGGYGWLTPLTGTMGVAAGPQLSYKGVAGTPNHFTSESYPVTAGTYISANWQATTVAMYYRQCFELLDSAGTVVATSAQTAYINTADTSGSHSSAVFSIPAGVVAARMRFDLYSTNVGGNPTATTGSMYIGLANVKMLTRPTSTPVVWSLVSDPFTQYYSILGPSTELTVDRQAMNLGTLEATILDATLDPAISTALHAGKKVRLLRASDNKVIFYGTATELDVTYDPKRPDAKSCRIQLTAVDNFSTLGNTSRPNGVATIDGLRDVLEGCRVPWKINGSRDQITPPLYVAFNDGATALDQVIITRDSVSGYAFVDREGSLVAFDAAHAPASLGNIDENLYSDIQIGLGPWINQVTVVWLRYNPNTGETEEVTYGPYVDQGSVDRWGASAATFRVQGTDETTFDIPGFAADVLAANKDRKTVATQVSIALSTTTLVNAYATIDQYDRYHIKNTAKALDQDSYLTRVRHQITPDKWLVILGTDDPGQVAEPIATTPPSTGAGGLTLGQLLRPVGEVTMFMGAKADIPTGWLALDGSTFSSGTYPTLATLLGSTTLPDFTDRFPIGAGSKALNTTGGNPTKAVPPHTHSTPNHTHPISSATVSATTASNTPTGGSNDRLTALSGGVHAHGGATGSDGASTTGAATGAAFDVMPPWRALWFIIRAK